VDRRRRPADASFSLFVAARTGALVRFAYVLCGDHGFAEDLVQDALISTHRRWGGEPQLVQPEAYVRKAIVNHYISRRRRRSASEVAVEVPDVAIPDFTEAADDHDRMWQAIAELVPRQRAVLVLRYYAGMEDAAIAEIVGCARGTVRSLASRALDGLRSSRHLAADDCSESTLGTEAR
jgi:RNA polymerase sigma-70 factor (sigma-E family)